MATRKGFQHCKVQHVALSLRQKPQNSADVAGLRVERGVPFAFSTELAAANRHVEKRACAAAASHYIPPPMLSSDAIRSLLNLPGEPGRTRVVAAMSGGVD